jgi:hypothetical protein
VPEGGRCGRFSGGRNGEGGIRTRGTFKGYNALAKRRFRPLSHLTRKDRRYKRRRGKASKGKDRSIEIGFLRRPDEGEIEGPLAEKSGDAINR